MSNFWKLLCLLPFVACVGQNNTQEDKGSDTGNALFANNVVSNKGEHPLTIETRLDKSYYHAKGDKKEAYLYIEVRGAEAKQDKKRAPLNVSLVLDRSGSMKGDKMVYAKKALDFVIDQLSPEDMLSIVAYDDAIDVVSSSSFVKNKAALHKHVSNIHESGSTNLCGGMIEGYVQIKSGQTDGYIRRNLLISDGLANAGVTDPQQIQRVAEKYFKENGIATSTFGIGLDYNENLMTGISESGGGNYYFIDNADKIPNIFAKELQGLLQVVAQSAKLKVKFPSKNLKVAKVYGYPYTTNGDEVSINFSDVFSQEEKTILIKFEVTEPMKEDVTFESRVSYIDASSLENGEIVSPTKLTFTHDLSLTTNEEDAKVKENRVLFESSEMLDEIMTEVDNNNVTKAKTKNKELEKYMHENKPAAASPRYQAQEKNVSEYKDKIDKYESMPVEEQKSMQKAGKSANYEMKKRK